MVIDRCAFLAGDHAKVFDEIAATKEACGPAHLKVILETGELVTYDNVRLASEIAMQAGGDFIKTSTGKVSPAATMPVTLVMLEAIRDHFFATGIRIGMKPAGGIRTSKQALAYLVMVKETLGDDWLNPQLFRFGASTLVNDVLMQIAKQWRVIIKARIIFRCRERKSKPPLPRSKIKATKVFISLYARKRFA